MVHEYPEDIKKATTLKDPADEQKKKRNFMAEWRR